MLECPIGIVSKLTCFAISYGEDVWSIINDMFAYTVACLSFAVGHAKCVER